MEKRGSARRLAGVSCDKKATHATAPNAGSEPRPQGSDWVEWGGECVWAAGFTEGGAPFGLSVEAFRAMNATDQRGAGWVRAKAVLERALERWAGAAARVHVGWITKVGDGLSREVFAAEVEISRAGSTQSGAYAALLPTRAADADLDRRATAELGLLVQLGAIDLPFQVPAGVGVVPDTGRLALVREFIRGVPLDPRAGRQGGIRPWQVIGEIAAAIHSIDATRVSAVLGGVPASRREHAEVGLAALDVPGGSEIEEAAAWAREHLPPPEPSVLVHGDLLGQNILLRPDEPTGVIDWEYSTLGDPAYDLAVVTRGVRRPFQIDGGLERLLDVYAAAGGANVSAAQVRVHELCLAANWYREALAGRAEPPDEALARFRAILRRALASSRQG